jgi:hypothetical protein
MLVQLDILDSLSIFHTRGASLHTSLERLRVFDSMTPGEEGEWELVRSLLPRYLQPAPTPSNCICVCNIPKFDDRGRVADKQLK